MPSLLLPRDYQEDAIYANFEARQRGKKAFLNVLATGLGKTVIFSWMAHELTGFQKRSSGRTLILVHRDELVTQTVSKLRGVSPTMRIGVIKGKRHEIYGQDTVVASVQSLGRSDEKRLKTMASDYFEWIVVDEGHHAPAASYQRILNYFGAYDPKSKTVVSGFTATPVHASGDMKRTYPDGIVFQRDILWGIRNRHLVDVFGRQITLDHLDLSKGGDVSRVGGEFGDESLGKALMEANYPRIVAKALNEHAALRQSVVYCPSVELAEETTAALQAAGRPAELVTGTTPLEDRAMIYKRVNIGETQDLVNCSVLVEGFDAPPISTAVIPPTMSEGKFIQEAGRTLRPWKGHNSESPYPWRRNPKQDALLLLIGDGVTSLTGVQDLSEFTKGKKLNDDEHLGDGSDRIRVEEEKHGKVIDLGSLHHQDVDLFAASGHQWLQTRKGYWFIQTENWILAMYPEDKSQTTFMVGKVWCGKGKRQTSGMIASGVDQEYGMRWAEQTARELDHTKYSDRNVSWRRKKEVASDAQKKMLDGLHVSYSPMITKAQASDLISVTMASLTLDGYQVPDVVSNEKA